MADNVVEIVVRAKNETAAGLDGAKASATEAAGAMDELAVAEERQAAAAAELSAKGAALAEVQQRDGATAGEVAAAEREYAAALENAQVASAELAAAVDRNAAAQDRAALAAKAAGDAAEVSGAKQEAAGSRLAAVGGRIKLAALGVAVGMGLAVKGAADFQDQTTHLVTDAGELPGQLAMVQQGILKISAATGTSASAITDAMYHIESGGIHGASGLVVLKVAAQGAKVGGAELDTVGKTLVGTLNAYGQVTGNSALQTKYATQMMNALIATVGAGDMRMQDLAASLGNVAPVAAAAKISFAEVGGAISTMTAQNMSAQQATQDLRHTILSMENPNAVQRKELLALGLTARQVQDSLGKRGLAATLQMVAAAAKQNAGSLGQTYVQALAKAMGGTTGLNTALMLTGPNMATFSGNAAKIAAEARKSSSSVDNWSRIQGTLKFKLDQAKASIQDMGISLGTALLPAVTAILGPLSQVLSLIAGNRVASIALAAVIGGVLAGAVGAKAVGALKDLAGGIKAAGDGAAWLIGKIVAMTAAQEAQTVATEAQAAATEGAAVAQDALDVAETANPIGLIIVAVVALIAAIVLLATHWKQVWHFITSMVDDAVKFIKEHWKLILAILTGPIGIAVLLITRYWHDIVHGVEVAIDWVKSHWPLLLAILTGPIGLAALFIVDHWRQITDGASRMLHNVVSFFTQLPHRILSAVGDLGHLLWNAGISIINGLIGGLENAVPGLKGALNWVTSMIPSWKGPMDTDRQLLTANGQAIMGSLVGGLQSGMPALRGQLQRTTQAISGGVRPGTGGYGGYGAVAAPQEIRIIFETTDGQIMSALMHNVRVMGGDPAMFQKKVAYR